MIPSSVKILCFLLLNGFCMLDCALIGSPSKLNYLTVRRNDNTKTAISQINSAVDSIDSDTIRPEQTTNRGKAPKLTSRPRVYPLPPKTKSDYDTKEHNEPRNTLDGPLQESTHSKIHNDKQTSNILKNETPKIGKKYHHVTIEELRQRRKELKEKWQARHNALLRATSVHNKPSRNKVESEKFPLASKQLQSEPLKYPKKIAGIGTTHSFNQPNIYEQVTPRTRRILQHKDETESLGNLSSPATKRKFSARIQTITSSKEEETHSDRDMATKTKVSNTNSTNPTDFFKPNHITAPIIPDPSVYPYGYWDINSFSPRPKPDEASSNDTKSILGSSSSGTQNVQRSVADIPSSTVISKTLETDENQSHSSDRRQEDILKPKNFTPKQRIAVENSTTPTSKSSLGDLYQAEIEPRGSTSDNESLLKATNSENMEYSPSDKFVKSVDKVDGKISRSSKRQGDIRPFGYGPFVETVVSPMPLPFDFKVSSLRPNEFTFKLRAAIEKSTTPTSISSSSYSYHAKIGQSKTSDDKESTLQAVKAKNMENPSSAEILKSLEEEFGQIHRFNKKRRNNTRSFGYGPKDNPYGFYPSSLKANQTSLIVGKVAENPTTTVPKISLDDVVKIKIEPTEASAFANRVYTVKTDTAPFYRNMTFQEKFEAQRPILINGKSAESLGSNDLINGMTDKDKDMERKNYQNQQISDPVKSAENVGAVEESSRSTEESDSRRALEMKKNHISAIDKSTEGVEGSIDKLSQLRHGKRSSEHTTSSPEGSAMKILEDPHLYEDWRENLRRAVRERILELSKDSK